MRNVLLREIILFAHKVGYKLKIRSINVRAELQCHTLAWRGSRKGGIDSGSPASFFPLRLYWNENLPETWKQERAGVSVAVT